MGPLHYTQTSPLTDVSGPLVLEAFISYFLVFVPTSGREVVISNPVEGSREELVWDTPLVRANLAKDSHYPSIRRRKNKCIKYKGRFAKLMVGEDISMPEVVDMVELALVGRANGRRFSLKTLNSWVKETWSKHFDPFLYNDLNKRMFMLKF